VSKLLSDYFAFAIPGKSGCLQIGSSTLHVRAGRVVGFDCASSSESLIPQLVDQGLVSDREARLLEWAGSEAGDAGSWTSVDQLLGPDASKEVRSRHLLEQISNQLISNQSLTIREGATKAGQDLGYSVLELPFLGLMTLSLEALQELLASLAPPFRRTHLTEPGLAELGLPEAMIQQLHAAGPGLGGLAPPESDPVGIAAFVVMWASGLLESETTPAVASVPSPSAPIGMGTLGGLPRIRPPGASTGRVAPPVAPPQARVDAAVASVAVSDNSPAPPVGSVEPTVAPVAPPMASVAPPVASVAPPVEPVAPPVEPVAPPVEPVAPPVESVASPVGSAAPPIASVAPPIGSVAPPAEGMGMVDIGKRRSVDTEPAISPPTPSPFPPTTSASFSAPPRMPNQRVKPPRTQVMDPLPGPDTRPRAGTGRDRWTQSTGIRDAMPATEDRPILQDSTSPTEPVGPTVLSESVLEAEKPAEPEPPKVANGPDTDQSSMAILHEILELMRSHHVLSARDKLRSSGFSEPRQAIIERYLETLDPGSHDPGGAMNRALSEIQVYSQENEADFVAPLLLSRIYARAENEKLAKVFLAQARRLADA